MKIFALLFAIFALVSSATALKNAVCGLKHSKEGEEGYMSCHGFFELYSYKADTNECVKFIYGGCNGNDNQFGTVEECETMCKE